MLSAIGEAVLEITCGVTGHGMLWLVGRRRAFEGGDSVATVVGLLFWVAIGICVYLLRSR